jgi:hypothetical protein
VSESISWRILEPEARNRGPGFLTKSAVPLPIPTNHLPIERSLLAIQEANLGGADVILRTTVS